MVLSDRINGPTRGYDLESTILAEPFLDPMVEHMNALGWGVYSFDHEGGDGQYEFNFDYADALTMADRMVLFRLMAKHVAREVGCIATFMPKPFQDDFGSASHINISLADAETGRNVFAADTDAAPTATCPATSSPACLPTLGRSAQSSVRRSTPTSASPARGSWTRSPGRRCTEHGGRTTAP